MIPALRVLIQPLLAPGENNRMIRKAQIEQKMLKLQTGQVVFSFKDYEFG